MSEGTIEMRPTMTFRWVFRVTPQENVGVFAAGTVKCMVLQQQFVNTATGQTEWRDVPVVEEGL